MTDQAVQTDPVHDFIASTVRDHEVVLFMKGTPDAPRCGFSSLSVQILDQMGASFVGVDVLRVATRKAAADPALPEALEKLNLGFSYLDAPEFGAAMKRDHEFFKDLVPKLGIRS